MNRYRIIALIYAVLLFGGLLGSLFLTGHFAGDYTAAEGTPGARTETALRQNLPLRDALKRWKTTLLMLGGVQELDGIYFTGEGLIENLTVTDEALGEKNLAALQDYCREAEPYTVLLPSACAISSQLLPEAALLFDQETWLQNAAAALSPLCREVLNAYPLLEENGDSRLFYRTDSRPTQLTGYLLYQALGQALDYFPYAKDSFSNTPLRYDCTGDLYARWSYDKVRADVVTALLPLEDSRSYTITHTAADGTVTRWNTLYPLEGTAGIDCILGGPAAIIAVTAEGSIPRSLLILGDENALCVIPYLALHYDRITYVDVTRCSEEQLAAIKFTVDTVNHRVPVIAGAGSNDTDHGCALAAKSAECGADALLLVTPYYNKTSQAGLIAHFTAMADAAGIPVILYNVPSRTGLNIAPETALELSKHPLINGIKEASGNISQVAKIAQLCGDELNIYSGNDDQVVPLLSLGGKGVISVVSNVKPQLVHDCCQAFFDGDTAKARDLQLEMLPLADALFCEVNPIPVKYAMNVLGWEAGECRLPLVEPSDAHKEQIEKTLQAAGLIQE